MIGSTSTSAGQVAFSVSRALKAALVSAVLAASLIATLAACAPLPVDAESERLDSNTGTTVTLMPRPLELIADRSRGPKSDPFAYLAPFETNRMGSHELFLWVSAPQIGGPLGVPQVYCGDELIRLESLNASLESIGLSSAPYKVPAPWSVQWYFKLSGEVLDCFARASRLRVVTQASGEEPDQYTAEAEALAALGTFTARVRT